MYSAIVENSHYEAVCYKFHQLVDFSRNKNFFQLKFIFLGGCFFLQFSTKPNSPIHKLQLSICELAVPSVDFDIVSSFEIIDVKSAFHKDSLEKPNRLVENQTTLDDVCQGFLSQ